MIKVFVLDQEPLFRQGVCSSLSQSPDMEVSGEAGVDEKDPKAVEDSLDEMLKLLADKFISGKGINEKSELVDIEVYDEEGYNEELNDNNNK